jgi:hypothetical protein
MAWNLPSDLKSKKPRKRVNAVGLAKKIDYEPKEVKSLSELAETTIMLKCKVCGIEQHIPIQEFVQTATKKPYLCKICPDSPEMFVYKSNPFKIMMAGFVSEQKNMGIEDELMTKMIATVTESQIKRSTVKQNKKKQLKSGDKDE